MGDFLGPPYMRRLIFTQRWRKRQTVVCYYFGTDFLSLVVSPLNLSLVFSPDKAWLFSPQTMCFASHEHIKPIHRTFQYRLKGASILTHLYGSQKHFKESSQVYFGTLKTVRPKFCESLYLVLNIIIPATLHHLHWYFYIDVKQFRYIFIKVTMNALDSDTEFLE